MLEQVGVPQAEADLVADHLVESGLLGHDSHSVLRYPQYVNMARDGTVTPGAPLETDQETAYTARLGGGWNFGPVTATQAMDVAIAKAATGALSVVTVTRCNHIARLGRFAAQAARQNMIAILFSNGHGADLSTAPFGGRQRRLPTNPMCFALPTDQDWPIVLDMTTSMVSGGALRLFRNLGTPVPAGRIIDAQGNPTTDPAAYYGPPPGAMLPLGMPHSGHKGFGLAVLVDLLAGALSGGGCSQADPPVSGNALFIAVLNISAFTPLEEYLSETARFIASIKSSPPAAGFTEVMLPGEKAHQTYLQRQRDGLEVDATAWEQITALATELGVTLPMPL
jgi:uncharacterized oxidoreductase